MPKVVRFHKTGDADVLQLDDLPRPQPGAGEVVIDVAAFSLNRAEIMFREGNYPQYEPEFPSAIGYEASGVVSAVGDGVTSVAVGDKVSTVPSFKMGPYWTYGEVALVPEHASARVPQHGRGRPDGPARSGRLSADCPGGGGRALRQSESPWSE